jgi:flagellum-specific peptidoglycan hydrolase FlgJ
MAFSGVAVLLVSSVSGAPAAPAWAQTAATGSSGAGSPSLLAQVVSDQDAVVAGDYQPALNEAQAGDTRAQVALDRARSDLTQDLATVADAGQVVADLTGQEGRDQAALDLSVQEDNEAVQTLATDQARWRSVALAFYTSGTDGTVPQAVDLFLDEQQLFGQTELGSVAHTVVALVRTDIKTVRRDAATVRTSRQNLFNDQARLAAERQAGAEAGARVAGDRVNQATAQGLVGQSQEAVRAAQATQQAAVAALGSSTSAGGLSVSGHPALTAAQLTAWFDYAGYADETPASVGQLASWYLQDGDEEGVRGDVAFAQAILETGGFISSDAVNLNNYAGIGHCDNCAQGYQFPSPADGVLGQIQLLEIFADPGGGSGGPPPVLPSLTAANQSETGCCSTWESLTGVWATDPYYGAKILSLYDAILQYTIGAGG